MGRGRREEREREREKERKSVICPLVHNNNNTKLSLTEINKLIESIIWRISDSAL